ncbi:MAG: EboA domain-containing protein [Cyanobacteria bacterium J06621_12]
MLTKTNIKTQEVTSLLSSWLKKKGAADSYLWLENKISEISETGMEKVLFSAYSAASRYYEREQLSLSKEELQALPVEGWNPQNWTLVQIARSLLLLSFPAEDSDRYVATLDKIIAAADVEEAIAFYQTLPLLPHPEKFQLRAAEGIRTNMTSVFKAIAHHNSYPANYLDDLAWNQMVLKALFVDSSLQPIYGLSQRNNPQLSQMLIDYARERLAAKRTVSAELWELVMTFQPEIVRELKETAQQ